MINSVEKIYIEGETNKFCFKIITDSEIIFVPNSEENRHYQAIQEWIAAGGIVIDNAPSGTEADGGTVIDNGGGE